MGQKKRAHARPFTSFRKNDDGRSAKVVVHPSIARRRLPNGNIDFGGIIEAMIAADLANDPPEGGLRTLEKLEEEDRQIRAAQDRGERSK